MQEFLSSGLFQAAVAIVAASVVIGAIRKLLFPPKADVMAVRVRCTDCGWTGQVGKYNRKCSKCNSASLREMR